MVLKTYRSVFRDAYTHIRREGPRDTLKAALRQANISYEGYYYFANYRYKRLQRHCVSESELFRTLWIDPASIIYLPTRRFDKWLNMGEIRDGNWDQPDGLFDDRPLIQTLQARFEDGISWDELRYVQQALKTVRNGGSTWNGCRSLEDVRRRCKQLDGLYETIHDQGFKSQAELHGTNNKSILLSGTFDRSKTDIVLHIGRNGELLFVDGNHRLAIAKILDIDSVPVRICVRHEEWQQIREQVANADVEEKLPESVKRHRSHPDLRNIYPSETNKN